MAINNKLDLISVAIRGEGDMKARLDKCLRELQTTAITHAQQVVKIGGISACFRSANGLWKSFAKHLKDNAKDFADQGFKLEAFPQLDDMYVQMLAQLEPEMFYLCLEQKAFLGYTLTPGDQERINRAKKTLQTDKQPRLALRMYQNFSDPANKASVKNQHKR